MIRVRLSRSCARAGAVSKACSPSAELTEQAEPSHAREQQVYATRGIDEAARTLRQVVDHWCG